MSLRRIVGLFTTSTFKAFHSLTGIKKKWNIEFVFAKVDISCLLCDVLKLGFARNKNKPDGQ